MKNALLLLISFFLLQQISFAQELEIESLDFESMDRVSKSCSKELDKLEKIVEKKQNTRTAKEAFDRCVEEALHNN